MAYYERRQLTPTKENLKDKYLHGETGGLEIQITESQNQIKKLSNRPPVLLQKPVLRCFEAQSKLKQLKAFDQENCNESSLKEREHVFSKPGNLKQKNGNSQEVDKEQSEKNLTRGKFLESGHGSSMILERIQKLKKNPVQVYGAQNSETKERFVPRKETKGSNQTNTELPKSKNALPEKQPKSHDEEEGGTLSKTCGQTKLYKLITLQHVSSRSPRKPARPPSVNLDSMNKDAKAPGELGSDIHVTSSRPISILTEEQENEEMLSFPVGKRVDRPLHRSQSKRSSGESEELYQELD